MKHDLPDAAQKDLTALEQFFVSADQTISNTPHFANLHPRKRNDLVWAIGSLRALAARAEHSLQSSPWGAAALRGDGRELRLPWDQLPPDESKKKGSHNRFERYRQNQLTLDHCRAAERAALSGDWIAALCSAVSAGNHSQGDQAITGRARGKSQFRLGSQKPLPPQKLEQRTLIFQEARALKRKNFKLTVSDLARQIAKRHSDEPKFPKLEAIRKILGPRRSWENPT